MRYCVQVVDKVALAKPLGRLARLGQRSCDGLVVLLETGCCAESVTAACT